MPAATPGLARRLNRRWAPHELLSGWPRVRDSAQSPQPTNARRARGEALQANKSDRGAFEGRSRPRLGRNSPAALHHRLGRSRQPWFADRIAQEGFRPRRVLGAEAGGWNVAGDSPGPSEHVELVSHPETRFALTLVVEDAPVGVPELQRVLEHCLSSAEPRRASSRHHVRPAPRHRWAARDIGDRGTKSSRVSGSGRVG